MPPAGVGRQEAALQSKIRTKITCKIASKITCKKNTIKITIGIYKVKLHLKFTSKIKSNITIKITKGLRVKNESVRPRKNGAKCLPRLESVPIIPPPGNGRSPATFTQSTSRCIFRDLKPPPQQFAPRKKGAS